MDEPLTMFQGATFTVTTRSGREFQMRELSGIDVVKAGSMVPEDARGETEVYLRIAMALVSVDGKPFPAATGKSPLQARLQMISGSELDDLTREYFKNTNGTATNLPKKSPPAAGSQG